MNLFTCSIKLLKFTKRRDSFVPIIPKKLRVSPTDNRSIKVEHFADRATKPKNVKITDISYPFGVGSFGKVTEWCRIAKG